MSELYDLPNGWEWTKLKNVCDLLNGYAFKATDYVEKSDTVLIRMGNIRPNGSFDANHKIQYLPNKFVTELPNFVLTEGDLIIAMTDLASEMRILGNPTLVTNLNGRTFMLNQRVGKLCDFDFSKIIVGYLRYIITAPQIKDYYKSLGGGGLQINIGKQQILSVDFPLPPLSEQQRIVSKLDLLFQKIDKSIELHQKNMDEADAFMGSVLNEVFGELEVEKSVSLKEITTKIGSGATPSGGEKSYKTEGISLIRSMNVHDDGFRFKNLAFIDESQAKKLNNVIVEANDVLLNITGASVARCCIVDQSILPARVNQHVSIIRLKSDMLPSFLHYYLVSPSVKSDLLFSSSGGATREAITKSMIEEFTVPLPLLLIQQKIVDYLDSVSEKMEKVKSIQKEKMESLKALKASILDKAFRGEL